MFSLAPFAQQLVGNGRTVVRFCTVHEMLSFSDKLIGLDTDAVKIESIEVFPDPPEPGKDMTVKVKGIAREVIEVSTPHFSICYPISLFTRTAPPLTSP